MQDLILAIDQGTTGTTVLLLDTARTVRARGYREFAQIYPRPGEVEHDPEAIWASVTGALGDALAGIDARRIAAIGITNQRETTLLWDRADGRPVGNAIVWQDRRTAPMCEQLKAAGHEPAAAQADGAGAGSVLLGDEDQLAAGQRRGLRARAEAGAIAFGTVDSFLIWRLTGGKTHATDVTNASRTLLFDIGARRFDRRAVRAVRRAARDAARDLPVGGAARRDEGRARPARLHPDHGRRGRSAGGAVRAGLHRAGRRQVHVRHRRVPADERRRRAEFSTRGLLTTVAWTLETGATRTTAYALEGSAFIAGALVQWLRDGLGIYRQGDRDRGARAFGARSGRRHHRAGADRAWRAALAPGGARPDHRLTRGTTKAHIARAALEAIALQNVDLVTRDAGRRRASRSITCASTAARPRTIC